MSWLINGTIYPSQKAAAQALGVTQSAISNAVRLGRHDRVGKNLGRLGNTNAHANPVTLFGVKFRSQKEASEQLGISRRHLRRLLEKNTPNATKRLSQAVDDLIARRMAAAVPEPLRPRVMQSDNGAVHRRNARLAEAERLLSEGKTQAEVAAAMGIHERTVREYARTMQVAA